MDKTHGKKQPFSSSADSYQPAIEGEIATLAGDNADALILITG
jgi:hypothetical protein